MQFQVSTPQTMGAYIATKESRKASKRKAAQASDIEPSTKKQKLLDGSVSLIPASALALAPAQSQTDATTSIRPNEEAPKLTDASLPPAPAPTQPQIQTHNSIELGPAGAATKKRKLEDSSVDSTQIQDIDAQVHNVTNLEPATKKQKLSYANLSAAKVRKRILNEEYDRIYARNWRKRLEGECRRRGHDHHILDRVPDPTLLSDSFDLLNYLRTIGSNNQSTAHGAPGLGVDPVDGSSVRKLKAEIPELGTYHVPNQNIRDPSHHLPSLNTAIEIHPVSGQASLHRTPASSPISRGRPDSGDEIPYSQFAQNTSVTASCPIGGKLNEAYPSLSYQGSTSSFSVSSTPRILACQSPDHKGGHTTSNESSVRDVADSTVAAISSQNVSVSLDGDIGHDIAAAGSDNIAPMSPGSVLTGNTTHASSSQTLSVGPPRNRGGRPRGRKPLAPKISKTPKGPMRFQKNHPVKAAVNIDVWENILSFCPPDFLLKARTVSSTFLSMLKADSPIWKISRVRNFGGDMPDPPAGLSEPQYADLLTGTGCQTRGCKSKKTRKTYWAFQKRLCMECFQQAFLPVRYLDCYPDRCLCFALTCL